MSLRLSLFDSWTPDLVRPWERVLASDPHAGIFSTPWWLQAWWETLGSGEIRVSLVWDGDEPIAVFPACTCVDEEGLLSFLGGDDVTDEQVPVAVPGREVEALRFFSGWAFSDGGFDRVRFHSVTDDRWLDAVSEAAAGGDLRSAHEEVDVSPGIALPDTFDDYLRELGSKQRHELRRKRRRLGDAGEWRVRKAHELGWEEDLAVFFDFHRSAPGDKAEFFTPDRERFLRRLAADLFLLGLARLDVLDLDGEPVACTFSYDFRGTFALYNSSFRPDLAGLSPGMVLVGSLIEQAIGAGHRWFDFLRGDEAYKYRFGAEPRPVRRVVLATAPAPAVRP